MSRAKFRKVHGKYGSGRFAVSEGVQIGCFPDLSYLPELATPDHPMFEIVIPKKDDDEQEEEQGN